MPTFDNLDSLMKHLSSQLNDAMNTEVKKVTRNKLKENIIDEVYEKYEPSLYERTGGLYQDANIKSNVVSIGNDVELTVYSERKENGKNITEIIETGEGYTWENSRIAKSKLKRPFHSATVNELEETKEHIAALKRGFKARGIDVQ